MGRSARYDHHMPVDEPDFPDPEAGPESALPSVRARVIAFGTIIAGGAIGGLIGFRFMSLQCTGSCSVPEGLGMVTGTLIGAIGFAVISVLSLRAVAEWNR